MSLKLIKAATVAENSDDLHLARLLFLLSQADKRSSKSIEGIMKLAKLDFLLRYPNCLEKVLLAKNKKVEKANIKAHERTSIESKMIRFRYGPWDERYRRWIGLLISKGLAISYHRGRTVYIELTEKGRDIVSVLNGVEDFTDLKVRSELIYKAVGSESATNLKKLIYKTFPEIINMKWGQGIEI
jgi:hypothetical protein